MNIRVSVFDEAILFEFPFGSKKIIVIQTEINGGKNTTFVDIDEFGNHKVETYTNDTWTHSGFLVCYLFNLGIANNAAEKIKKNLDKALELRDKQVRGTVFNFEV